MAFECVEAASIGGNRCSVDRCQRPTSAKGFCNTHYLRDRKGQPLLNDALDGAGWGECLTLRCAETVRSKFGRFCETHYYRLRRTGSDADPAYTHRYLSTDGYVLVGGIAGHPVANADGIGYEHRVVLYDAIGGGRHVCHWCRSEVAWKIRRGPSKLVVDHLDADKQNNERGNLVPACHRCNTNRGLFMNWVMKHRSDPFMARLFEEALVRGEVRYGGGSEG